MGRQKFTLTESEIPPHEAEVCVGCGQGLTSLRLRSFRLCPSSDNTCERARFCAAKVVLHRAELFVTFAISQMMKSVDSAIVLMKHHGDASST